MSGTEGPGGSLSAIDKASFKRELTEVVPHLRAFARGLCGRPDLADDLVQETLLKAWAAQDRFEPGTSMRAWTFVILRNAYLTDMRRNRFRGEYDEGVAERILTAPAGQEEPIHLSDLHRALLTLPAERREALLLVGAGGVFLRGSRANLRLRSRHDQKPRGPCPRRADRNARQWQHPAPLHRRRNRPPRDSGGTGHGRSRKRGQFAGIGSHAIPAKAAAKPTKRPEASPPRAFLIPKPEPT